MMESPFSNPHLEGGDQCLSVRCRGCMPNPRNPQNTRIPGRETRGRPFVQGRFIPSKQEDARVASNSADWDPDFADWVCTQRCALYSCFVIHLSSFEAMLCSCGILWCKTTFQRAPLRLHLCSSPNSSRGPGFPATKQNNTSRTQRISPLNNTTNYTMTTTQQPHTHTHPNTVPKPL